MGNDDVGAFGELAMELGLSPVNRPGSTRVALLSVVLVDIRHRTPVVFLAQIPPVVALPIDVLEAGRVGSATGRQASRHIVWPLLRPALTVVVTFRCIPAEQRRGRTKGACAVAANIADSSQPSRAPSKSYRVLTKCLRL